MLRDDLASALRDSRIPFKGPSFIARRIRLVDWQPAKTGLARKGDVPCGIKIGVELETTTEAFELAPLAVPLFCMATSATPLRCEARVNEHYDLS